MAVADEYASNDFKRFDWSRLPAGEYKMVNGDIIPIDRAEDSAENLTSALRRLAASVEESS